MAALSSSRFFESCARPEQTTATSIARGTPSIARGTPYRLAEVLEIAARVRAAVAEAALFLWTVLVVGFLLLVTVSVFL